MARYRSEQQHDPIVAAIERVLEAERIADAKLQDCREQAATIIETARTTVETVARRLDARIARLHAAYMRKVQNEIATLTDSSNPAGELVGDHVDVVILTETARRLTAKLTGDM